MVTIKKSRRRAGARKGRKTTTSPALKSLPSPPATGDAHGTHFPIVGIGASAGGMEALIAFMTHVPADCGFAIVVIVHLDPVQKSALPELLQRQSSLPVIEIRDRTRLEANHVYVLPPGFDLGLRGDTLLLLPFERIRGQRLTIDRFFRALAESHPVHGIGVVLSGAGSDGTLGLGAIRSSGGATFVQDPASASVASMPESAIAAGVVDGVSSADRLPALILEHWKRARVVWPSAEVVRPDDKNIDKILAILRRQTRQDFTKYKRNTIARRIERRMSVHHLTSTADYVAHLQANSQEAGLLLKELLIGVTSFFRDAETWQELKQVVVPALLDRYPEGGDLRAWIPGCSTGEEAYSLAMIFSEVLEERRSGPHFSIQIFATDIDGDAIAKARTGEFGFNVVSDVSPDRLRRFFSKGRNGFQVNAQIRKMLIFAQHNVAMEPPFTRLDLLSCRNLLIYLASELQTGLIRLFHHCLKPGGVLLLGSAETVGGATDLFSRISDNSRFFRRLEPSHGRSILEATGLFGAAHSIGASSDAETRAAGPGPAVGGLQSAADQMLLQKFAPSAVLVSQLGDIVYVNGRTGNYLEPAAGKVNLNVVAMAREGLREPLAIAFRRAVRLKTTVRLDDVAIETPTGSRDVEVVIRPVDDSPALSGMFVITFQDVTSTTHAADRKRARAKKPSRKTATTLARELARTEDALRVAREKMAFSNAALQTLNEQLQSANEELQSMNEELQSTNEELVTSKEEMQSMNEELQTMNQDLQAKVDELSTASNDMANLLNSTEIATLFLDEALNVRRFTPRAADIIKLIPGDAGRPITDLATSVNYPALADDARAVLRTLIPKETRVPTATGGLFKVRIMPYRTHENRINGVVITFIDVSGEGDQPRGSIPKL